MAKQNDDQVEEKIKQDDFVDDTAEVAGEVDEFKGKYLRALADYQNLERQTAAWKEEFVQYSNVALIRKVLEVLDDLEKAQEHIKDEGLQLVVAKLKNILLGEGLEELELEGKVYNPTEAEVVTTEAGEKDNVVVKVLLKGYRLRDKIIRPAKVIVSINKS